jgi:hypothetical protein
VLSRYAGCAAAMLALGMLPALADPLPIAVIRVLDKVTARVRTIEAPIDQPVQFATLSIIVRTCDKRPPEETPESAAFLEITEGRVGEARQPVFSGWMFASTPSLSAMEHPIYDVWVIDCLSTDDSAPAATPSGNEE